VSESRSGPREELADFGARHAPRTWSVDGVPWRGFVAGRGDRAVLLLPGYLVGPEDWFRVIPRLEDELRVVAPALPPVPRVDALLAGLAAILEQESIASAHVVGQSLGALYGEQLARRHPALVRSLTMCHGSPPRTEMIGRVRRGVALGALLPTWMHRLQWRRRIAAERTDRWPDADFWRAFLAERVSATTKADFVGWGRCYLDLLVTAAADGGASRERAAVDDAGTVSAPLAREAAAARDGPTNVDAPVLLVESEDDPVVAANERTDLAARHPRARVHAFAGTGHWTPELEPDALCDALRRSFDEADGRPSEPAR